MRGDGNEMDEGRYRMASRVGELESHANSVIWEFDALPEEVRAELARRGEWFVRRVDELRTAMETGVDWSDWRTASEA